MNYWAVTKKASTTKTLRSLDERPSRGRLPESQSTRLVFSVDN